MPGVNTWSTVKKPVMRIYDDRPLRKSNKPIVFVDRDGVINHNRTEHVLRWEDFHFEDGALEGLRLLSEAGFPVIVITNQAAIERGLVTTEEVDNLHERMVQVIEASGGHVSALLYCPHRPETGCNCRKPQPGLLFQAADNLKVSLKQSWLVGDYITDIQAGLAAGCKPVLVLTGRGQKALENWSEIQDDQIHPVKPAPVDVSSLSIKQNLLESANFILASEKKVL